MLEIQRFLREGGTFADLDSRYAIKAKRHGRYPNLVLFKYHQIDSPFGERIVQEARGIILDEMAEWEVASRSFDKFFNYGEGHAAPIDWSTARVQEKVDGSLCVLYHYDGRWQVATSGTPDASGEVYGFGMTFADLFWETWDRSGVERPGPGIPTDLCLSFELTSPFNRIVVRHQEPQLTLLTVRDRVTGKEISPDSMAELGRISRRPFRVVREFPLNTIDAIIDTFRTMDPLSQEGYVVVDGAFRRVKVKHPGYVAIHHMRGEGALTPKRILEIVRSGETSEVLANFPEWRPQFEEVQSAFEGLVAELEGRYSHIREIPVQKDFALEAVKARCSGALFAVRAGKAPSIRHFLSGYRLDGLVSILGLRGEEAPTP